MLISISVMNTGCSTKVVPPGTVVIVLSADGDKSIHAKGSYYAWGRDRVYYVDTKLKSFTENMKILCTDEINMLVDIKWVGSFKVTKEDIETITKRVPAVKVKEGDLVGFRLSLDKFYHTAMRDIIRSESRSIVSKYTTDNINAKRDEIRTAIKQRVVSRFKTLGYPIVTVDIMVSNLDYPKEITDQRKAIKRAQLEDQKQAALAKAAIAQAKRKAAIAAEEGKAQIITAKADAEANRIRAKSLTPEIIQMRQWDTLQMIGGRNGDLMIVPYASINAAISSALTGKSVSGNLPK